MGAAMDLQIALLPQSFDPLAPLQGWQGSLDCAAEALFIGRVRPHNANGASIEALELEHYPGMTERQLEQLALDCGRLHGAKSCLIQHRIGRVFPGETIVLVAIGADRRGPAQRCCQQLLEALKHDAPFWKREWLSDGSGQWLMGNTAL